MTNDDPKKGTSWEDLSLEERVDRLQYVVIVLASWLYEAQTGLRPQDVLGIQNLLQHGSIKTPA